MDVGWFPLMLAQVHNAPVLTVPYLQVETERKLKKSADSEYDLKVAEIVRNVVRASAILMHVAPVLIVLRFASTSVSPVSLGRCRYSPWVHSE